MFEQSLAVSQVGRLSYGPRWMWAGSFAVQCFVAASLVMVPMLHPERMVLGVVAPPRASVPLRVVKLPEAKVRPVQTAQASTLAALALAAAAGRMVTVPATIPRGISAGDPPAMGVAGTLAGMGSGLPGEITGAETAPRVAVRASATGERRGPVRISSGVGAGMLMTPIRPVYPQIARAARVAGAVLVEATISREGRIERARVVSGPAMLASAALEAVEAARYTPYRLNGQPVEVETTITVNFRLGS